eukprot:TRINITY_DN3139_c0_g1_i1.p1 TRINITY_DN3139_c0_g1~~TRINITY_DN3139_c0_g1_i1.p1  ORF type:complete len:322 (+),score=68.20 TRINITY_DN3139_c0_g1_i1:52-1017(+)
MSTAPYHSPPIVPPVSARASLFAVDNLSTRVMSRGQLIRFIALQTVLFVLFWLALATIITQTWSRVALDCTGDLSGHVDLYYGLFSFEIQGCCEPRATDLSIHAASSSSSSYSSASLQSISLASHHGTSGSHPDGTSGSHPDANGSHHDVTHATKASVDVDVWCLPCGDRRINYNSNACEFGFCTEATWAGILAGIAWIGQMLSVLGIVGLMFFFRKFNIRIHELPMLIIKGFGLLATMAAISYVIWHAGAQVAIDDFVDACPAAKIEYSNIGTSAIGCLVVMAMALVSAIVMYFRIMRNRENYQEFLDSVYRMNDDSVNA